MLPERLGKTIFSCLWKIDTDLKVWAKRHPHRNDGISCFIQGLIYRQKFGLQGAQEVLRSRLYHCRTFPSSSFPTPTSATACYVLFSHRQPSGTKLSATGKRHDAAAQTPCNGFLVAASGGGFYKPHCGRKVSWPTAQHSLLQLDRSRWNHLKV